ncbi:hypothetical protein A3K48_00595 [candidate division WOR-1 bacterium RIFOXYA12_FULL_52_29]|uniref:Uncharacterized protein n=1 Tax=candidate division WOR-1 bacterium RIFOXYC12_FULL_54_18 TaxID=1802584 RepID=A0A1F4T617_UNCSA|nr:MAG: hypothetical protein A3K44_00595 [candidate division WOR-1 bacterium RIFOXYA2_FULL_51_19]OGC17096.1 MAG: hypothetical protein A3K48_00595 [candidate division WOR-1 bacterium RIFOXYA12_FULL_52_29]OGC25956.1 MAG: hypothetical protein A3K32_00590 [candidate division WOR-1 bacterium RIFOXYB2_FULL_45_9]OGC27513.1 MAG: hypothetical protein A3K49_00595 [candidate division WOR-1 bacterium RIFOXYC12_FULL_54_18]OGC29275.1 MAG: hypothetical protein A2346_01115 [candidate division WOR-1 bacterium R
MRSSPINHSHSIAAHQAEQTGGVVSPHPLTTRLMQNRLAKQFFDKAPESVQDIINQFNKMMNNTDLMKVLAPNIEEIEKLGPAQIIAQARITINNYLDTETAFTRPEELPNDNLLVNNFFAITPNGKVDLSQFLSQNLVALQMIGDPAKYARYSGAILSRFEKIYYVLRAGEILANGNIIPIASATPLPVQTADRLDRDLTYVITENINVSKIEDDTWRETITSIIITPHPLPVKALLEEAIRQFAALTPEARTAEARKYDHSIHQPGQADLPHPYDARELETRGFNWALGILTAFRSDRTSLPPADLTEAFRTALVWLSVKYDPALFLPKKKNYLPKGAE